jgi:hypothetical protein
MSQTPQIDVNQLWRYVVAQVKAQTTLPGLWRSMEAAKPIAFENEELVVGYSGENAHQKGLLADHRNRNTVEQILFAASRRQIRLRIIEGDTREDWEAVKSAAVEAARLQEQSRQKYQQELQAGTTWEAVGEQVVRKVNSLENRAMASVQGRFLEEAIAVLAEAYGRLMPETPAEADERTYSRILDRVSDRVGVSSSMLAYLVHQHRKGG